MQAGLWGGAILGFIFTAIAGRWAARKAGSDHIMHGLMVGLVAALAGLIMSLVFGDGIEIFTSALSIVGGLHGGWLAGRS